jgi:hypothetical protein
MYKQQFLNRSKWVSTVMDYQIVLDVLLQLYLDFTLPSRGACRIILLFVLEKDSVLRRLTTIVTRLSVYTSSSDVGGKQRHSARRYSDQKGTNLVPSEA